jgi:branched-chain amino acid transport system ATP-binding protein
LSSERTNVHATALTFQGASILHKSPHVIARRGIAVIPERDKIFRQLLVAENIDIARGRATSATASTTEMLLELFPILRQRMRQQAGLLSGGQIQMLAISMAVLRRPTLLVADEISLGLAPALLDEITAALGQIRTELGITMLLVEQNVGVARRLCDRGLVLESGKVRATGTMDELASDAKLANIYLGGTAAE